MMSLLDGLIKGTQMKLEQTGVGSLESGPIRPGASARTRLQVDGDGVTTWSLEGRATPDAPWATVRAAGTGDHEELLDWWPELQLTVTSGSGTITAYIAASVE